MKKFKEFIGRSGRVSEQAAVYYIHWVELAYRDMGLEFGEVLSDELSVLFFRDFGKVHEDWQVKQARHALSMYRYFLEARGSRNEQKSGKKSSYDVQWKERVDKMTKRLRLQHKSYRTEQSYVGWIRQFYNFLKGKDPDLLSKDDVRSFVSFLAVDRHVAKSTQNVAWNAKVVSMVVKSSLL